LLVGVGLAGVVELLWPSVVGGEAVADVLGVPLLGLVGGEGRGVSGVAARLRLAAEGAGLDRVGLWLTAPGDPLDLSGLAARLEQQLRPMVRLRPFRVDQPPVEGERPDGLVVVSPATVKRDELDETSSLLQATPLTPLGLITYRPVRMTTWSPDVRVVQYAALALSLAALVVLIGYLL
jgi:hypothetical protein